MLALVDVVGGYGRTRILNGISFAVPAGKVVAILGGNGTGKSTALKAIAGLVAVDGGSITFDGRRIEAVPPHRRIGRGLCLVPQGKEVFAAMSVEENLLMGAFHRSGDRAGIRADLQGCWDRFPRLAQRRTAAAGSLSGGERQMLAIGRALMSRPRLLMLDEPSAALAPKVIGEIVEAVRGLAAAGMTILLVEQNVSVALELASYLYIVRDGRIAHERPVGPDVDLEDLRAFYLGAGPS
ncbi:MAG: ABC transporter ATP-binding protein [Alphaproteobacteria bacterium]|nr:ABC transporter ATP-binding protein [Alphaproteobacteria bacterium]